MKILSGSNLWKNPKADNKKSLSVSTISESMSPKSVDPRHSIDSCTFELHTWRPFHGHHQQLVQPPPQSKTLDASPASSYHYSNGGGVSLTKRPCLADRSFPIETAMDVSRLSLVDENNNSSDRRPYGCGSLRLLAGKRRRRGSRSVSGRSSDRSGTRRGCSVGASAAHGTCSDFPVAVATDSSGELFFTNSGAGNDPNWSTEVSEARSLKNSGREREKEKESFSGQVGGFDHPGIESGYGSEPGYRGDAEFGYGDEHDEEEEDPRLLFWGDRLQDSDSVMENAGESSFSDQKAHYRYRRKKHDCRMLDSVA